MEIDENHLFMPKNTPKHKKIGYAFGIVTLIVTAATYFLYPRKGEF